MAATVDKFVSNDLLYLKRLFNPGTPGLRIMCQLMSQDVIGEDYDDPQYDIHDRERQNGFRAFSDKDKIAFWSLTEFKPFTRPRYTKTEEDDETSDEISAAVRQQIFDEQPIGSEP